MRREARSLNEDPKDRPPSGPRSDLAWALRAVLKANSDAVAALSTRLGLGVRDVEALQHLAPGPLGPAELAHRLGISTASATLLLDRLERADHIRRRPHPHDQRRKVVTMTPHARQAVLDALEPLTTAIDHAAAALSPAEAAATARFLTQAADALTTYAADG
jgi:DNA-binding MarR family transcriptional regulator